jgi:hypothetical protein
MKKTAQAFGIAIIGAMALAGASEEARAECLAPAPPVHRSYIRRDVVEPGVYEVARATPAYGWTVDQSGVQRRILLQPYKNYAHFQRPYIAFSREHLTIQPEEGSQGFTIFQWLPSWAQPGC